MVSKPFLRVFWSDMVAALQIRGLCKSFGHLQSLKDVSFDVQQGEFFGLLGPNGAGKTTLISIVAGLARATAGHVSVMGHDVRLAPGRARACLGVVPQELVFDPFFTVRETLQFQSGYFGLGRNDAWIDELLHELNLIAKADVNMRALSGGMKRRVLVAQALVHRPPLIILDEPTAGVDVELRQILWKFVARLNREGHAVMLTTHYLEEAEALCQRIAILRHGQLIRLDSTPALLASHSRQTVVLTLDADCSVTDFPAWAGALPSSRRDQLVFGLADVSNLEAVLALVRERGLRVTDIDLRKPDLEDVFVSVVQAPAGSPINVDETGVRASTS